MKDFNITWKTIPNIISVILYIIALALLRISFGWGLITFLLIIPIERFLFKNKSSNSGDEKGIYSVKGKVFVIAGFVIMVVLVGGAVFYGSYLSDYLV